MLTSIISRVAPHFIKVRQAFHAHPELGFEEVTTATVIVRELIEMGLDIRPNIAKTGIVAIIDSQKPGKTVALRAEIDALPLVEQTHLPYASKNFGKMHACGHDGHAATLLAAAKVLSMLKDQFKGKIKLIFSASRRRR